ncbi:MAG: DoxX family protein, partial [Bacteroidia bacterium]|nr:DoxX family protein [Bacteroidia bacterium]
MTESPKISKTLNVVLWLAQALLAATFFWAAYMKLFSSPEQLANMWPWTAHNSGLVKFTGVIDLLGGLGLILSGIFNVWPKLTVVAAYGSIALMVSASVFHISRGEGSQIGFNIFV